jgi:hypothetical protein
LYLLSGRFKTTMPAPSQPQLEAGRVYRTRDLAAWGANAPRLAKRLVRDGVLVSLGRGLFVRPKRGRFGVVPPADNEIMRAFLDGTPFVLMGPERWNTLRLGTTAMFAAPLVCNTKRSGTFEIGSRRFILRRVAFPARPTPDWYVIDLFEHAAEAGSSRPELAAALARAVGRGRFDCDLLLLMARRFGTRPTQVLVEAAVRARRG